MSITDNLRNSGLLSSALAMAKSNRPSQYADRQHQYYGDESAQFIEDYAKYSSDYVVADVQGLKKDEPYEYTKVHLRFAEIIHASAAMQNDFDDFKLIMIAEAKYEYIRKGAKIRTMGNTWLAINPPNMSSGDGQAVVQRCDAVWHYLDYYGNVCTEPMCISRLLARANDDDAQRSVMVAKGYFDAKMQYNDATKNLRANSRLILGSGAYRVTGYSDFIQEFTDDYNSINMIAFTLRFEEPNLAIDDMENHVAGGKTFSWEMLIGGKKVLNVGDTEQFTVRSIRTSEEHSAEVESSEEHPIDYIWESSDDTILSVTPTGEASANGSGEAVITCTLKQNPSKTASYEVTVHGAEVGLSVKFTEEVPSKLRYMQEVVLHAVCFENGEATEDVVSWELSGANENAYEYNIAGNTLTVKCWGGSINPLKIMAMCNGESAETSIQLVGV